MNTHKIQVRLSEDEYLKLQEICKESNEQTSDVIRHLIGNEHALLTGKVDKFKTTNQDILMKKIDFLIEELRAGTTEHKRLIVNLSKDIKETNKESTKKVDKITALLLWANKTICGLFYFTFRFLFDMYKILPDEREARGAKIEEHERKRINEINTTIDTILEDENGLNNLVEHLIKN
jgi:hypothetical protein